MDDREVGRYWERNAAAWTQLSRSGYDTYRDLLNTPAFLALLPDVTGGRGLDIGCGEGHNTRQVAERGVTMTGVDIASTFVDAARDEEGRRPRGVAYVHASAASLPFATASFDFTTAFMSLMDIPDLPAVLAEVARVIRPGGFLQFSIEHPFTTAGHREWIRDEHGTKQALAVAGYFNPGRHDRDVAVQLDPRRQAGRVRALPGAPFPPHLGRMAERARCRRLQSRGSERAAPG